MPTTLLVAAPGPRMAGRHAGLAPLPEVAPHYGKATFGARGSR